MSRRTMDWQVSDLGAEFHINPRTIRYYERIGLLTASARTPRGYRVYSSADRDRLSFILKAKATGLTLGEIREVLATRGAGRLCRRLRVRPDRAAPATARGGVAAHRDRAAQPSPGTRASTLAPFPRWSAADLPASRGTVRLRAEHASFVTVA